MKTFLPSIKHLCLSLLTIVEDIDGNAMRLEIKNLKESQIPENTYIIIKEPFYKEGNDGIPCF